MKNKQIQSNLLLLLTAAIWGLAFVAQRVGMDYIGPFTFNAVRFLLGSISLIPAIRIFYSNESDRKIDKRVIKYGIIAGIFLFAGSSLQQVGLIYTTAAKAGFITSLYIILVPIIGIFIGQKTSKNIWIGAVIAVIGLYLLSVKEDLTIGFGDLLQLIGAFFWAMHIILIGEFSNKVNPLRLSQIQFATCSLLSFIVALLFENIEVSSIVSAYAPILYGGILSVGVAYTLQVVAQKNAKAGPAAIALSMEAVFAVIGGILFLNESLDIRGYVGCGLMLAGMLISQLDAFKLNKQYQ
ncbi:DMT family transporter [Soehngenia longivitae]|jgi:drug/metabolite transporter (DMT)-like permease|uniref:DMT family transporter n=1 Tax=Soehngenia longivitae TaxID=2562294 RepID=A0A4Z0D7B0_9FIRM|nr:DMT family transporter [Soehngenia longivitae]TFZ40772.1 DMT family transporter [Soehngenia longivitae]